MIRLRPFLRWAGGKQHLVTEIIARIKLQSSSDLFVEPFVGAASVFFALAPSEALLADANPHLIGCYRAIRDKPEAVATALVSLKRNHGRASYYRVRAAYNAGGKGHIQAARFIYLNRTCFNGIFRVNRSGEFNVPIGSRKNLEVPDRKQLLDYAKVLKNISLSVGSFDATLAKVKRNWFVYLDPPYPPLNGTSFFTHYTKNRFDAEDQERLAHAVQSIDAKGARFLMTNANTPQIRKLYKGFNISKVGAIRYVSCKKSKKRVTELVITNFSM